MSRREDEDVVLNCPLTGIEQDFVSLFMQMTRITSEANIVRLALFHLGKHLGVAFGSEVFSQRKGGVRPRGRLAARMSPIDLDS